MRFPLPILALMAYASSALAAGEASNDRFSISLGAFITDRDTDTRLDSETLGRGTDIDFEDALGLDASGTFARLDGYYRFNRRHRFDFAVFDLSRDASATIDEQIQFGDEIFDINTVVSAEADLLIVKAAYTWSFLVADGGYLGLTAGLYTASAKASISEPTAGRAESDDLTAPLPVVGLRGEYAIAPRWTLRGSGEIFKIEIDDVDGSLSDFYVGVDYQVVDRMAIGLGYNSVSIDIDSTNTDFSGDLDWTYDGALLYFKFGFGEID